MDYGGPAQEVEEGKNIRTHLRYFDGILRGKKGAAFKPCPKPLPEAKLKSNRLISLAVKISRRPNTVT